MIDIIYIFVVTLFLSVLMHEVGHWLHIYIQTKVKPKPVIYFKSILDFGIKMQLKGFNIQQKINNILCGVSFGMFPIMFVLFNTDNMVFVFLIPIYMAGCRHDLKLLMDQVKIENEKNNKI